MLAKTRSAAVQRSRTVAGMKLLAVALSAVVYGAFVVYSEYHFFNLVSEFVPGSLLAVGLAGVAVSALTAVTLPLAIHFWFRSGMQQVFGLTFYGLHFVFVVFNLILDSNLVRGGELPGFVEGVYGVWILPASVAAYGLAWTALWFVDDGSREIDRGRELAALEYESAVSRRMVLVEAQQAALDAAFESAAAKQAVNRWAARNAPKLLAAELGMSPAELGVEEGTDFAFWPGEEGRHGDLPLQDGVEDERLRALGARKGRVRVNGREVEVVYFEPPNGPDSPELFPNGGRQESPGQQRD